MSVTRAKTYAKATFRTTAAMVDEVAGMLVAAGALGCAVTEMARPGTRLRKTVTLEAYFDRASTSTVARIRRQMDRSKMLARDATIDGALRTVTDPGWATMWQRRFEPFHVGGRFLIAPPWNRRHEPGRTSIVIQPGRAFGTGHHPSTAGALRALERILSAGESCSMLDVGTGSGVLAIAAALAGVPRIVAIDIDTDALENARENAELNRVTRAIRFSAVPLKSVRGRFDLLVANILATVVTELAPEFAKRLSPTGTLVLGGILARETPPVLRTYRELGLRCVDARASRGWTTLVLSR
jgi:ribosomal protein L11 methyltransferase